MLWSACSTDDAGASDSGSGDVTATVDAAPDSAGPEVIPPWNATGTGGVPVFGECRFTTGEHFAVASDGVADDVLKLDVDSGGQGTLTLRVRDALSVRLEATAVTVQRGLKQESYRRFKGSAVWGSQSGEVIDGMLCFENRLTPGVAAKAELTLILENGAGERFAATGRFVAAGASVDVTGGVKVDLDAVDIDLR